MHVILSNPTTDILKFVRGEEFVSQLLKYCQEKNIQSAWFQGLGAGSAIEFSYYDFEKKEYVKKQLREDFEINNITGNIALLDGKLITHCHISISRKDFSGLGGHVFSLMVSGTLELNLTKFETPISREFDSKTGLNLLKESQH